MSNIVQINDENGRPQYYDFGTKNKSFLLTCQELKTLGIKNWYFPLLVKYPQLGIQDLDPHSPDLTPEQIGRIHIESKTNIWYWLRECAKVPARGAPRHDLSQKKSAHGRREIFCLEGSSISAVCCSNVLWVYVGGVCGKQIAHRLSEDFLRKRKRECSAPMA